MFTNLDFTKKGSVYPIKNDTFMARQENYINGRLLYDGHLEEVFKKVWQKIKTRFKNNSEAEQILLKLNLFKPLTDMFELLAFQNEPEIVVGEGKEEKKVSDVTDLKEEDIIELLQCAFISAHAQGTGVYKIYDKGKGDFDIALVNPENWIPVYEETDLKTVKCHVVSKLKVVNNDTGGFWGNKSKKYVYFEIHYKGYYDILVVRLDNEGRIAEIVKEEKGIKTGLDDFAVVPFDYGKPTWKSYSPSAYNDLIPIVEEIMIRFSNQSAILDKHADPTLVAPAEAFEIDQETGEKVLRTGYALQMGRDGQTPQYITWDGNLTASFKQIEEMMKLYYMISGANPQLFGQDLAGNLSGEALQKILIVPLAKTKKMLRKLEMASEKAFNMLLKLKGVKQELYIKFNMADFTSATEYANIVMQQKQGGLLSTETAIQQIHSDWEETDIKEELERIMAEKQQETAMDLENIFPKDKEKVEDEE